MCYDDFVSTFESINLCEIQNWYEQRLKGKFIKSKNLYNQDKDETLSKFFYRFTSSVA